MIINSKRSCPLLWSLGAAALATGAAPTASADQFKFVYTGAFDSKDALNLKGAAVSSFTGSVPFTATAFFDTASPNIAAPISVPGFVAYSPYAATLTVGGNTYNVQTYNQNPTTGVTVAIFDNTTPFGIDPVTGADHYAIGLLQDPLADGAGFVGDWLSASTPFSATHLVATTMTDYIGVGYGSGYVTSRDAMGNPLTNAIVPIPLTDAAGNVYSLTLGNYNAEAASSPLNTASIQATPEPGAFTLLASSLVGGMVFLRKRNRRI